MEKTVLIPAEGKKKFKFTGISPEQTEVLKKDRDHLFKVLAAMGGAYIAYDTFKNLTNISREQWDAMLPDELERFLSPLLDTFIDVEQTIAECEDEPPTEPEIPDEAIAVADVPEKEETNKIPENEELPEKTAEETDKDPNHVDIEEEVIETMEEIEIDEDLIIDATINELDFTVDEDMLEYINSNEIIADLNEESAEAVIINDDYIATEEIEIVEDLLPEEEAEIIADEDIYWDDEYWEEFYDEYYYYYEGTPENSAYASDIEDGNGSIEEAYAEDPDADYEEEYDEYIEDEDSEDDYYENYEEGFDDGYIDGYNTSHNENEDDFPSDDDTLNFDDIPDNI